MTDADEGVQWPAPGQVSPRINSLTNRTLDTIWNVKKVQSPTFRPHRWRKTKETQITSWVSAYLTRSSHWPTKFCLWSARGIFRLRRWHETKGNTHIYIYTYKTSHRYTYCLNVMQENIQHCLARARPTGNVFKQ